jgi:hypothetical protein
VKGAVRKHHCVDSRFIAAPFSRSPTSRFCETRDFLWEVPLPDLGRDGSTAVSYWDIPASNPSPETASCD